MDKKRLLATIVIVMITHSLLGVVVIMFLADMRYARGRFLADKGYLAESAVTFEKATSLWPREPRYHKDLARQYAILARAGEPQDELSSFAVVAAEQTFELNPENLITLKSVISTYYLLAQTDSKYQEDLDEYTSYAVELCPTDPTLWYLKGLAYRSGKEIDKARVAIQKALELRYPYPEAEKVLQTL